jgi:hypothetical protein
MLEVNENRAAHASTADAMTVSRKELQNRRVVNFCNQMFVELSRRCVHKHPSEK